MESDRVSSCRLCAGLRSKLTKIIVNGSRGARSWQVAMPMLGNLKVFWVVPKSHRLQLNADKTEAIWVGSRSNLAKIANSNGSIQVGSSNIQPSTVIRDLGLHLDSELSMKHHVTKVAAACYYHLRRLHQIRRRVGQ